MKMRHVIWTMVILVVLVVVVGLALTTPGSPVYLSSLFGKSTHEYMKALDSPDDAVRSEAIHGIGALGSDGEAAVPALAKILVEAPAPQHRIEAALALSKMAPASRAAVPALAQALEDKELFVRMNAATALARLGADSRPATAALIKALKDKDNQTNLDNFLFTIQEQVALALGRATAGTAEGVPALMEALEVVRADKSVKVETIQGDQNEARQKLMALIKGGGKVDNSKSANTIIRAKMALARALGEVGPEARPAVPLLRAMIAEDKISDFKTEAEEALAKIEAKPAEGK